MKISDFTHLQLHDILTYDLLAEGDTVEHHLAEFWWFVRDRGSPHEWGDRWRELERQRWLVMSLEERAGLMDKLNEEAVTAQRVEIMLAIDAVDLAYKDLLKVMGNQNTDAIDQAVLIRKGHLASVDYQLPYDAQRKAFILAIGEEPEEDEEE